MSLKLFHIVFVTCSSLLAFLFGGWSVARGGGYVIGGIAAFLVGIALVVYGVIVAKLWQAPVMAALLSFVTFLFVTTVVEPLFLKR